MIISRDMMPRVMTYMSRDYQYLLLLDDLVFNSLKLDADYFTDLVRPSKCKSTWLPIMSSLVGWEYDNELSAEQNRFIISVYRQLLRLRGSTRGVELAVATYLKLIGRSDTNFSVTIPTRGNDDIIEGAIYINDENLDLTKVPVLLKLLDIVRPMGVQYIIRKSITETHNTEFTENNKVLLYQHNEDRGDAVIGLNTNKNAEDKLDDDLYWDNDSNEHDVVGQSEVVIDPTEGGTKI